MIVVFTEIALPPGTTRARAMELYRQTAEKWVGNPDLIEKYYYYDEERCQGGGVYLWPDRGAASRWNGDDYVKMVTATYGSTPRIQILDALLHVEPATRRIGEP